MTWYIVSLIQAFVSANIYFIDKIVVSKWARNPLQPLALTGFFSLIPAGLVYFIHGISYLSPLYVLYGLSLGIIYVVMFIFYFKSMQSEEVSRFIPFSAASNVIILILAAIFLKEVLGGLQYLGIILLTMGAILISIKRGQKLRWDSSANMLIFLLLISLTAILNKYMLGLTDFWTLYFYGAIGIFIGSIPLIFKNLKGLIETININGARMLYAMLLSESLGALAIFLILVANSLGPVSLVSAFSSLKLLFVFLISIILTVFLPKVLKEDYSNREVIIQKAIAIILLFIGSFIIFLE